MPPEPLRGGENLLLPNQKPVSPTKSLLIVVWFCT